jgi:hypothetical protein
MTQEDAKIIFGNIAELVAFSDMFVERLEQALGSVLDGGIGNDRVGALFLEIVRQPSPIVVLIRLTLVCADPSHGASIQKLHHAASKGSITSERVISQPRTYDVPRS